MAPQTQCRLAAIVMQLIAPFKIACRSFFLGDKHSSECKSPKTKTLQVGLFPQRESVNNGLLLDQLKKKRKKEKPLHSHFFLDFFFFLGICVFLSIFVQQRFGSLAFLYSPIERIITCDIICCYVFLLSARQSAKVVS